MNGTERGLDERPAIVPLGDEAVLVRFGTSLSDKANRRVLALTARIEAEPIEGVVEVVPSLVSVLLRYDPARTQPIRLGGEIGLRLAEGAGMRAPAEHRIPVHFDGPDLVQVASALGLGTEAFIALHNEAPLRVLATGFAPGFVYCGFHPEHLNLPRRTQVRPSVPAGSVLFAAGQTAIAATDIPTGWHVIGRTEFRNFDPQSVPPTRLLPGALIRFVNTP